MIYYLRLLSLFIPFGVVCAQPSIPFEKNKKQWPEHVKYATDIPGGKMFLEQNTFTYLCVENINWHSEHRNELEDSVKIKYHSYKVHFENSNSNIEITGNDQYAWHRNYYIGNDTKTWAENVPLFEEVYYKNLYEKIDMRVYGVEQNLKYDFIIHPGGIPDNIKLNYNGVDGLLIQDGNLVIKTSVYDFVEQKPYAYQEINGVKKEVPCSFILNSNTVLFSLGNYDPTYSLTIDPTLIASTYTGSNADNWGFSATYDAAGNFYLGGIAAGNGYPFTVGAWDASFNGGQSATQNTWPFDISITKFNSSGTAILYSTYYGGSNNEQPNSLIVNGNNELFVLGRTMSVNFPTTAGAYDQTYNGGYDLIVGKFNSSGNLLTSTFVGGSSDDGVNYNVGWDVFGSTKFNFADDGRCEVLLDKNSNAYIVASTRSVNFPTTGNAYDATLGGQQDVCVLKFNSTLSSLSYSSFLGGSGIDAGYGINLDSIGNMYITGGTASNNFPTTPSTIQPTFQGGITDGFVSVLDSGGISLLYSTYLGTSDYDQSFFIDLDDSNNVYVLGQTQGVYPISAGTYSNPNSGQFIHKLSSKLDTTFFSTVFGTGSLNPNITPSAFRIDTCKNIYIAGWGRCSSLASNTPSPNTTVGMPITVNAFLDSTDGCDYYFMTFSPNAQSLVYATFFGEDTTHADHVDGGMSRFDKNGVLYHVACASCEGTQGFPTTAGAYSTTNNGLSPFGTINCNAAAVKFDMRFTSAAITATDDTICVGTSVTLSANGCTNYLWSTGATTSSITASPTITTTYFVSCADSNNCFGLNSFTINVQTCLSITWQSNDNGILLFPNPSDGLFILQSFEEISRIEILNILGETVKTQLVKNKSSKILVDISNQPVGIYFVKAIYKIGSMNSKIIISR